MPTFVFVGDPNEFQVDRHLLGALSRDAAVQWPVRQHREQMSMGDRVFVMRSPGAGDPGIIALGRIVSPPEMVLLEQAHLWFERPVGPEWRARIDILDLRLSPDAGMVRREALLKSRMLLGSPLLKPGLGTNARLTHDQGEELQALWKRAAAQTLRG